MEERDGVAYMAEMELVRKSTNREVGHDDEYYVMFVIY
jgi:hypothetical protein